MAKKKPRTPTPPRPVQAPQKRTGPRTARPDDMGRSHRMALYAFAGTGLLGLIAVIAAVLLLHHGGSGINDAQVAADMKAAGCSYRTVNGYLPKGQTMHRTGADALTAKYPWNTTPPSNGQHYPQWAVWGFYTEPVNPRQVVHNEEHGGVILWWGPQVPGSTVEQLRTFYNEEPTGSFGTPYASLGSKVAISAWTGDPFKYQQHGYYGQGHLGICSSYTPKVVKAFTAFRKAFRGHGPEGVPLSADAPGLGP